MTDGNDKLRGMLGLAKRAGALRLGTDTVLKEVRGGRAGLVLLDAGAAENTRKRVGNACAYYRVPFLTVPEDLLGSASGTPGAMTGVLPPGGWADSLYPPSRKTGPRQRGADQD